MSAARAEIRDSPTARSSSTEATTIVRRGPRFARYGRPRHDRSDPQRVAAEPTGQQDAPGLRLDRDAPHLRERQIDPRKREERSPARGPRERPERVDREEAARIPTRACAKVDTIPGSHRRSAHCGGVDRHVAAAQVQHAPGLAPGHRDTGGLRRPRVPAPVADRDHPRDERERGHSEHPRQETADPRAAPRRAGSRAAREGAASVRPRRGRDAHDSAPARASAGHCPCSVRITPSS